MPPDPPRRQFTAADQTRLERGRLRFDRSLGRYVSADLAPRPPRRRRVVLVNPTADERQLIATGRPPPEPPAPRRVRRVTLADVRQRRPALASALVASGLRTHPVDVRRRPTWNGGDTYHDLVVAGKRLS